MVDTNKRWIEKTRVTGNKKMAENIIELGGTE